MILQYVDLYGKDHGSSYNPSTYGTLNPACENTQPLGVRFSPTHNPQWYYYPCYCNYHDYCDLYHYQYVSVPLFITGNSIMSITTILTAIDIINSLLISLSPVNLNLNPKPRKLPQIPTSGDTVLPRRKELSYQTWSSCARRNQQTPRVLGSGVSRLQVWPISQKEIQARGE